MQHIRAHVLVCGGTGCKANGSKEIQLCFAKLLAEFGLQNEVMVVETGCHGFCENGPLVILKAPSIVVLSLMMYVKLLKLTYIKAVL